MVIDHGRLMYDGALAGLHEVGESERTLVVDLERELPPIEGVPGARTVKVEGPRQWLAFPAAAERRRRWSRGRGGAIRWWTCRCGSRTSRTVIAQDVRGGSRRGRRDAGERLVALEPSARDLVGCCRMTDDDLPELRASDADRERVAEILRDAVAEGRLDMEEFEERLEATYKARTYGELEPITARSAGRAGATISVAVSLRKEPRRAATGPGGSSAATGRSTVGRRRHGRLPAQGAAGRWPRRFTASRSWGGGEIDLREADFADREVEISCCRDHGRRATSWCRRASRSRCAGFGIMGGFDHSRTGVPATPARRGWSSRASP